jgi:hypothetical protein
MTRSITPTLTPKSLSRVTSNAASDEVLVMALRGDVENTGNADLVGRVLVPIELTISVPARYTCTTKGKGRCSTTCSSVGTCSPTTATQKSKRDRWPNGFPTLSCRTSPTRSRSASRRSYGRSIGGIGGSP